MTKSVMQKEPESERSSLEDYRQGFETVAELASDGVLVIGLDGRIVFVSRNAAELLGYSQNDLINRSQDDLFSSEGLGSYYTLLGQAKASPGQRQVSQLKVLPVWGQELEVEVSLLVPGPKRECYVRLKDVSLSKIMEKELLKSNQFLRKIIMNSMDGIVAADISGNILIYNQGASKILGWSEEEVFGRVSLCDLFDMGVGQTILKRLRRDDFKDGSSGILNPLEITMLSKTGERIPVSLTMSSIYEWGQEVATVSIFTDLRSRVAMEKVLMETRDYLNNVLENAFDMIITTDLSTNIVSFNRGAERILGYHRKDVLGKSVEIFWPNPEERRALMRKMEHFDGAVSNFETKLRHKNGSLVDISLTLSLLTNNEGKVVGTVGISKDITDRVKAEAELQKTKDYLNAIVENTPDMIITTDLGKKVVSFNRGAEKLLDIKRESVLGINIEDLYVDPDERRALARLLSDMDTSVNYETQLRDSKGRIVDIDLTLSHLKNNRGDIIGTVGISKDITEKKKVEAELARKNAELEEAKLQILHNEKMASLGKLATSVAHEINNPLGGILLFCEMILEDINDDDPNRPDLLQIREQTMRCKEIVKGLLEFGRMTGTQYSFIDLNRTVDQGIALFANQAIFHNVEVIKQLDPDLPQIMGDASQLNQVFTNLIINAVDAMNGIGTLTIKTSLDQAKEEVRISFMDTGCGISPEVMPRLFEPFFTTKPIGEGVGLGLSTSYGIVRKHNGRIEVESEPDKGSRFTVCLPLEGPEQE